MSAVIKFVVIDLCVFLGLHFLPRPQRLLQASERSTRTGARLIVPGTSIGLLKIGDTKAQALRLFPSKTYTDVLSRDDCDEGYDWVDYDSSHISKGTVTIRFKKGVVAQIESGTPSYLTRDGISLYDSPAKIRLRYPNLEAYALLADSGQAVGFRPLIFWINRQQGIAFEFAFDPEGHKRYLSRTVVFAVGADICPEGEEPSPQSWHKLSPYSTDVPTP